MGFNPSKEVAAARDIANKFDKDQVIILMLDREAETMLGASYGKNKALCNDAKRIMDAAYNAVIADLEEGT